ncbi:MAG: NAD(P)-dependent oxidoreductase [Bacteroidota bacterium]
MKKVLITDGVHPLLAEGLQSMGFHCDYHPQITLAEVRQIVGQYDGLIINSKITVDVPLLEAGKKLRFVGRLGSGMEIIDQPAARERGVAVLNSPEGNRNAVAEHALGMLLALNNKLLVADREVRANVWRREQNRGREIMGSTVGLIGFGHTGSSFAQKLVGMGVRILAYDKYKTNYTANFPQVEPVSLASLCQNADIISLHLPLTVETRQWIDADFLSGCKQGAILLNTSRGPIVKTADLVQALKDGQLGGACLDVFENERPATFDASENALYDSLHRLPNVILSPHVAGWTAESKRRLASVLLEKIADVLKQGKST